MTREYEFAKKVTKEQADLIVEEGKELEKVQNVTVTDDGSDLIVTVAQTEDFQPVMERFVNIVARLTGGNTFTFVKFIYDD